MFAYVREQGGQTVVVALNFSSRRQPLQGLAGDPCLPQAMGWKLLISTHGRAAEERDVGSISLAPYEVYIAGAIS